MNIENTVKLSFLDFIRKFGSDNNCPYAKGTFPRNMRKEHSHGRKILKLVHCETKQYTTCSDTVFCGVCSGSALFAYELPPNTLSAYNPCGQSGHRAARWGHDHFIL